MVVRALLEGGLQLSGCSGCHGGYSAFSVSMDECTAAMKTRLYTRDSGITLERVTAIENLVEVGAAERGRQAEVKRGSDKPGTGRRHLPNTPAAKGLCVNVSLDKN